MGDTASRESDEADESTTEGTYTRSLAEFDRLCAVENPTAILTDLAATLNDQDERLFFTSEVLRVQIPEEGRDANICPGCLKEADQVCPGCLSAMEPTMSDKLHHLAIKNNNLFRRICLCQASCRDQAARITKDRDERATHVLEFLCFRASHVPRKLFTLVLAAAPEAARFRSPGNNTVLIKAVGPGQAPLELIRELITIGDRGKTSKEESVLAQISSSGSVFDIACSWSVAAADFSERMELLDYLLEAGGPMKSILCSRSDANSLLLHSVIAMMDEMKEKLETEYEEDEEGKFPLWKINMMKGLFLRVVSRTFEAWKGLSAPSVLFAFVWSTQYMTRWNERSGKRFLFDVAVDDALTTSILTELIEQDPKQLELTDERGNYPLHVAAGLECRLLNRYGEIYRQCWNDVLEVLLDADRTAASQRNVSGRLPIHIALANGMTWQLGVEKLFDANPRALRIADPCTRMLPFMTAASGDPSRDYILVEKVETAYRLLREDPAVILLLGKEL